VSEIHTTAEPHPSKEAGGRKVSRMLRWLPSYVAQAITRRPPTGNVHLIFALADHFEPAIMPLGGVASYVEQEQRLENWCTEYSRLADACRDHEGRPFSHTYFYPAEQYDRGLIGQLAEHCRAGWGEIEIHLHHGLEGPDTEENTSCQLVSFRDALASQHGCLSYVTDSAVPRYAFVHGNFALANSNNGRQCGVDSEIKVLSETGCFADLTLPTAPFHAAQTAKINSLYECKLPLDRRAAHRRGRDLQRGKPPSVFPLIVQGPLMLHFAHPGRGGKIGVENGALTAPNPASMSRLRLWKQAGISIHGRPDWLFIKLHCHSMDPTQRQAVLGPQVQQFLQQLLEGAADRREIIHFVSAREMVNIILAACDGREGNPGDYRDYHFRRIQDLSAGIRKTMLESASICDEAAARRR
jgi:hypothetical protein